MAQKKKSINSTEYVYTEEPLDTESSLLTALEDIPTNPVFFKVNGDVHKLPYESY